MKSIKCDVIQLNFFPNYDFFNNLKKRIEVKWKKREKVQFKSKKKKRKKKAEK